MAQNIVLQNFLKSYGNSIINAAIIDFLRVTNLKFYNTNESTTFISCCCIEVNFH